MAKVVAVLLLLAVASFSTAQAQKTLHSEIASAKHSLFLSLVECAGATKALKNPKGQLTVLVPTDAAIGSFLKTIGLTGPELLGNPALCKVILRYHVLPYSLSSSMITKKDSKGQTLDNRSYVTFNKAGGVVTVTDMQGNTGKVSKGDVKVNDAYFHTVDTVLWSDKFFPSVAKALAYHPKQHSELVAALRRANLLSAVTDPKKPFDGTLLAPTDAAFRALKVTLSPAALRNVLLYHVLPKEVILPSGIRSQKVFETSFPGHKVTFSAKLGERMDEGTRKMTPFSTVFVADESGTTAEVLKGNMFAGKGVIHGINAVLVPKARATTTESGPATSGRRLLQRGGSRSGSSGTDLAFRQQAAIDGAASDIQAASYGAGSASGATAASAADAYNTGLFYGY